MTSNPADVQDIDRKAARQVWDGNLLKGSQCPDWLTEAFAAHRIAALQQSRSAVIEECVAAIESLVPDSAKPSGVSLNANITIADAVNAIRKLSQESAD